MTRCKSVLITLVIFALMISFLPACQPKEVVKCKCKTIPVDGEDCDCEDDCDDDDWDDDWQDDDDADLQGWEWMDIEDTQCRDGSPTGIGIRFSETGSDKLAVYLEATGICFLAGQCEGMDHFNEEYLRFAIYEGYLTSGLFNREQEVNPISDWNMVYVPGCTGDMMAGNNPDGFAFSIPGEQHYVGFMNLQKVVPRLRELFEGQLSQILVWGMCSGGNATLAGYPLVADAFPEVPVTMLNDSGPVGAMDAAFAPCQQRAMRIMFNINPSLPPGCPDCTLPRGDGLSNVLPYLAHRYTMGKFGLMCQTEDEALRMVWGFGQDYCTRYLLAEDEEDLLLPPEVFKAALIDLRDNYLLPTGRWSTFYASGEDHTFGLIDDWIYDDFEGLPNPVMDWVTELILGDLPEPVHFEQEE